MKFELIQKSVRIKIIVKADIILKMICKFVLNTR